MPIPREPAFEDAEYRGRIDRLREQLARRHLDALAVFAPANVFYLCGMENENLWDFQALVVPRSADPILLVRDFERGRAENSSWLRDVVTYGRDARPGEILGHLIRALPVERVGLEGRRVGVTPAIHDDILAVVGSRAVAGDGLVESLRLRKSPAEIDRVRAAARISDAAAEAGLALVAPGVTDHAIAAEIVRVAYGAGSDTICFGPVVAVGYRAGTPHSSANGSVIGAGQTVFLELTGQVSRYAAPVMRTAIVGPPPSEILQLAEAGSRAVDTVLRLAGPGVPLSAVASAARASFERSSRGLLLTGSVGYPVGIGFQPIWEESDEYLIRPGNDRQFEAGMTFHVAVALRRYGEFGVNQSQTMVVTGSGAEALTRSPHALRSVPG